MTSTHFYTVFDYNSINMDTDKKKTKCCKKYKKKGDKTFTIIKLSSAI